MPSTEQNMAECCRQGLAHLEAGRFEPARQRFAHVLSAWPNFAPALHALGVIARHQRQAERALDYAHRLLASAPDSAQGHLLMARILCDLDRVGDALTHYRAAIAQDAADAQSRLELAEAAERLGAFAEAIAQYRAALVLRPADPAASRRLTLVLRRAGRLAEAEQSCQQRLARDPDDAEALFDLGNILYEGEQYDAAADAFRATLLLQPRHAAARENLGCTLMELGHLEPAEECLRQARAWHPESPGPHNALGSVLRQRGRIEEAEACFRQALALDPDHTEAKYNLATTLLLTGRTETAWPLFESRWGSAHLKPRGFAVPLWNGEALAGRTLLLHAEQGLGDTLQFCRFIDRIRGGRVILEVAASLARLMRLCFPHLAEVVVRGDVLPAHDLHCPLMSLPLMLGVPGTAFSDRPAYLAAPVAEQAAWSARVAALPGRRIGVVWQGNPRLASMRRRRDLPVRHLARLAAVPDVTLVSLQKQAPPVAGLIDWTDELQDMADTAALIANLDVVIGVDTSVIHLAGALGRPVWLLNRFDTCWRWMIGRDDSSWYPTLRQFRQPAAGDWESVLDRVCEALNQN